MKKRRNGYGFVLVGLLVVIFLLFSIPSNDVFMSPREFVVGVTQEGGLINRAGGLVSQQCGEISLVDPEGAITGGGSGCPDGEICYQGSCEVMTCSESDGGLEDDVIGETTVFAGDNVRDQLTDFCVDSSTLYEYYCRGSGIAGQEINCPGGCLNGECQPEETCGDGVINGDDICDGDDLGIYGNGLGQCDEFSSEYAGGDLRCLGDCSGYDFLLCIPAQAEPECNDGVIEFPEECEGEDFGIYDGTCSGYNSMYEFGNLICNDCYIDTSACVGELIGECNDGLDNDGDGNTDAGDYACSVGASYEANCGDGVIGNENGEECELDSDCSTGEVCAACQCGAFNSGEVRRVLPNSVRSGSLVSVGFMVNGGSGYYLIEEMVPTGWSIVDTGEFQNLIQGRLTLDYSGVVEENIHNYEIISSQVGIDTFTGEFGYNSVEASSISGDTVMEVIA